MSTILTKELILQWIKALKYEEAKKQHYTVFEGPLEGFLGVGQPSCMQNPHGHFENLAGML